MEENRKFLLSELKPGDSGVVEAVNSAGVLSRRLLEMGIIPGAVVEVVRFAPLGDPIDVKVQGCHLSLRRQEAKDVEILV